MKLTLAILALTFAAFVSGCSPAVSIRPLYTDADIKKPIVEPRIEGEWISTDPDEAGTPNELVGQWRVTAPDKTNTSTPYLIEFSPAKPGPTIRAPFSPDYLEIFPENLESIRYEVRLVSMGDKLFLDADFLEATVGSQTVGRETIVGMLPAHVLGRVWVERDLVRVAFLDSDWIKQHGPEAFWRSVSVGDADAAVLTATTDELRKFLLGKADDQEVVVPFLYLCRPGTDCSLRAMNEELRRRPEDKDLFEDAAGFFTARGDYAKAIELLRHAVLLAPKDAATHVHLGEALLFARDFAGARKEFTAIPDPTLKKPSACSGIMWSYFLEGNWSEVPQAAAKCKEPDNSVVNFSPEVILLSYYSLLRLGRKSEAEAYLAEETAKFRGPLTDHALLVRAQQRMDFDYDKTKQEQLRADFFDGLAAIHGAGWSRLKSAAEKAPNDSVFGLAAKVELERLGPKSKK